MATCTRPPDDLDAQRQASSATPVEPSLSARTVPADLLVDVPQLTVEELTLELEASLLLNRVKLDAKGLDAGLYVKADFARLQALARTDSGTTKGRAYRSRRDPESRRMRRLRQLLRATR